MGGLLVLGLLADKTPEDGLQPFDNTLPEPLPAAMAPYLPEASWGQLVGSTGEAARETVLQSDGIRRAEVVPDGSMMTMDFREDRVRIIVDAHGVVVYPPQRG